MSASPTQTLEAAAYERRMTLLQHLGELRTRLVRCAGWLGICMVAAYAFQAQIYKILMQPLLIASPEAELNYFSATEPFVVTLRISMMAGAMLAAPLVLLEAWGFIAPALTRREQRAVAPVLPVVLLLFAAGVAFIYYIMLPVSIGFLLALAPPNIVPTLGQQEYFGLVTTLCLAGGLLFEMPAVLGLAGALGFVSPRWLWQNTGYALLVLMVLAAVITPTGDAVNMLVLTMPLLLLYILSIGVVWLVQRGGAPPEREE